jgi:serine kinase of HPr protein (carbohydrate metabolism regulator)
VLVGDDAVMLQASGETLLASPHPNVAGLIEVRNLGLMPVPVAKAVPVALVLILDPAAPRHIETADLAERAGVTLPMIRLYPDSPVLALRAELALAHYGQ